jgi:hypothetical protein
VIDRVAQDRVGDGPGGQREDEFGFHTG